MFGICQIFVAMDPNIIIEELDDYSARTGLKPTTICQNALGNALFYERIKRRVERYRDEAERLRRYMADNPPKTRSDGPNEASQVSQ